MQKVAVAYEKRVGVGKGVARTLRREGKIPAVLYGAGASTPVVLNPKEIQKLIRSAAGENALITLNMTGAEKDTSEAPVAILRDYQIDPIDGKLLHADLFKLSMDVPITVKVAVEVLGGIPVGVRNGGIFQTNLRMVEVRCLPSLIPDSIQVNVAQLGMGESIHVKELTLPDGVTMISDADHVVVSVTTPISEERLQSLLTSGPASSEPEVLTKSEAAPAAGAAAAKGKKGEAPPAAAPAAPTKGKKK